MLASALPAFIEQSHHYLRGFPVPEQEVWSAERECAGLVDIIQQRLLHPVFQPILDYRSQSYLGFEGLIRGPSSSPLRRPDALFGAARAHGLTCQLEAACREVTLASFAGLHLPGCLFLNVSPACLVEDLGVPGRLDETLSRAGIAPGRVILELTENSQVTELPGIHDALGNLRSRGFRLAIDDLGEGFANLRMWSEVRPEFVKIDRHFVHGIADDRMKYHFVRAMQDLAESCSALLVAEGIERQADFELLRGMGVACAQGFFIAPPEPLPQPRPRGEVLRTLGQQKVSVSPLGVASGRQHSARALARHLEPLSPAMVNDQAIARFEAHPELEVLPVVEAGVPVGLVNRASLIDRFARPFRRELYGRRSCTLFMDHAPLIVDQHANVQELAMMLAAAPKRYMSDGFIVTAEGYYLGVGSSHDLMAMITEMQISAARYANPLTQLPGNVPINEHIDRLLVAGQAFVACYVDIDNFKPYNDAYGYRRGDEVIVLLGDMVKEECDPHADFIGHIGGDDFFILFQSQDWEERIARMLDRFRVAMGGLVSDEDAVRGGYQAENRKGELTFCPLPSLSVGALPVAGGGYESHREVAAATSVAKKEAKRQGGGRLFIERRRR